MLKTKKRGIIINKDITIALNLLFLHFLHSVLEDLP